ncbi:MAG: glycosyltransferase family 2 protein [Chloroflexi bacterium]|nr:glycosyltransferase family 2 protein [Chloroflexota bacterium]
MSATDGHLPSPVVSVLLPCWNAADTIERAIESVLQERSVDLECIVVDDGSTDRTADIVAGVAARDARVILVRMPTNSGVSSARNEGLSRVRGTWLTLLDADDRFLPGGLGVLARAAVATDARAVVGQQVWWDGRRRWVTSLYDIPDIRAPGRKSLAANPGLVYAVSPHAKLLHRSCFEGLRFSGRVLGDQPWIIRALIRAGVDIEVLGETVYEWYRPRAAGPSSITSATRASARRSVESSEVAVEAFAAVAAEAKLHLVDAGRDAILARYAERLLRADLGLNLSQAAARRDPGTAELIDSIGAFVAAVPARYLQSSDAPARDLLEPPLRHWRGLDGQARAAYAQLVATVLGADPACASRRPFLARIGLAAGLHARSRLAHLLAAALLTAQWLLEGAARRFRRWRTR